MYRETPCFWQGTVYPCATDEASAMAAAPAEVVRKVAPKDPNSIVISNCINLGTTKVPNLQDIDPEIEVQDLCDGAGGAPVVSGTGGSASACGAAGDVCGSSADCCAGLQCSLNACD